MTYLFAFLTGLVGGVYTGTGHSLFSHGGLGIAVVGFMLGFIAEARASQGRKYESKNLLIWITLWLVIAIVIWWRVDLQGSACLNGCT